MKARSIKSVISSVAATVAFAGTFAAFSANANSGLIRVTHSDTPYRAAVPTASATTAKTPATATPTAAPEVQVAVMAQTPAPAKLAVTRAVPRK